MSTELMTDDPAREMEPDVKEQAKPVTYAEFPRMVYRLRAVPRPQDDLPHHDLKVVDSVAALAAAKADGWTMVPAVVPATPEPEVVEPVGAMDTRDLTALVGASIAAKATAKAKAKAKA